MAAALICLPDSGTTLDVRGTPGDSDTLLLILLSSLDRIVARARCSLQEGRLNTFDQHRLNSFIAGRSSRRPIIHNMREETYKKYGRVLQHLLCYIFRLAWQKVGPKLHYRLTDGQAMALVEAVCTASELAESSLDRPGVDQTEELLMISV